MSKKPYVKPNIEIDEYLSEKGFATSFSADESYEDFIGDVNYENESVDKGNEYGFHYSFEDL